MNEVATRPASRASMVSRFPAHPIAGLAGTSLKHEHLPAILPRRSRRFLRGSCRKLYGRGRPAARRAHPHPLRLSDLPARRKHVDRRAQPLDKDHLGRFKALVDRYEPGLVSEHLAWSTHDTTFFNDLLPLPYTQATLARVADHIDEVQETIGRPILLENPSTYVLFEQSTMSETDFIREVVRRTGCGLLLDVNNVSFRPPTTATPRSPISPIFRLDMWARSIWPGIPSKRTTRAIFCSSTAMMARSRTRYGNCSRL